MEPSTASIMSDHDLLIELKTTIGFIRGDIRDLKDNLASRVTAVEVDKIGRTEASKLQADSLIMHNDHETRIRALEKCTDDMKTEQASFQARTITWGSAALIALGIAEFALNIWYSKH